MASSRLLAAGIVVAVLALVPSAYAQCKGTQVPLFGQCGGRSAPAGLNAPDPSLCCSADALCRPYNVHFWQCQPRGYTAPPEPPVTYPATCSGKKLLNRWEACGGITSFGSNATDPAGCCPSGFTCNYYDDFFYQCQPEGYKATKPIGTWDAACTGSKVSLWGMCGGLQSAAKANASDAGSCCPLESACTYYNDCFWQCQPPGWVPPRRTPGTCQNATASPSPAPTTTVVVVSTITLPIAESAFNKTAFEAKMASEQQAAVDAQAGAGKSTVTVSSVVTPVTGRRLQQSSIKIVITITIQIAADVPADKVKGASDSAAAVAKDKTKLTVILSAGALLSGDAATVAASATITVEVTVNGTPSAVPSPSPVASPSPSPIYGGGRRRLSEDGDAVFEEEDSEFSLNFLN